MKAPRKVWEMWTMNDGTEISVGEMTEQHLRNTLNLILKRRRESIESEFKKLVKNAIKEPQYWRKD